MPIISSIVGSIQALANLITHELRETKYMMYVANAADPFRSIRQPLQVEKMGN